MHGQGLARTIASKPMTATTFSTKRSITVELTNRQWALLACALSVGCSQLPPVDAKDAEILYRKVSEAIFPE